MKQLKTYSQIRAEFRPVIRHAFLSQPWAPSRSRRCCSLKASPSDPYKVLKISPGSSLTDIKAAYYQQMKKLHPDVNAERDTTEDAVELNIAYTALLQGKTE